MRASRRWLFWLMVTPLVCYWMIPPYGSLDRFQRSNVVVSFMIIDAILFFSWTIFLRKKAERSTSKRQTEVSQQGLEFWLPRLMVIPVILWVLVPFNTEEELLKNLYHGNPIVGFALQTFVGSMWLGLCWLLRPWRGKQSNASGDEYVATQQ